MEADLSSWQQSNIVRETEEFLHFSGPYHLMSLGSYLAANS
jgi:hypothetical protein